MNITKYTEMNCFEIYAFSNGVKFVANAQALLLTGSAK
ncbi:hypothetical protein G4B88_007228 [Cannabis sativa]|uniref:Uncharacterized protein n=1 Tax=Cannabis sativa TaxID=3483 RepID=A0A7J6FRD0_CANSA|nr:hypothetical protein G4B88_007228 [Cannabis sativa]